LAPVGLTVPNLTKSGFLFTEEQTVEGSQVVTFVFPTKITP